MTNHLVEKEVVLGEGKAVLSVYPAVEAAIQKGWESLYFSRNLTTFATLVMNDHLVTLETCGDVRLLKGDIEEDLRNSDEDEIREIIDAGKLDDYTIGNNNWFSLSVGEIVERKENKIQTDVIDDTTIFEACPTNLEEFEQTFIEYAQNLFENVA